MTISRDHYLHTLGLNSLDPNIDARVKDSLARAYQQRSFEIEHYWKRATYFWGFEIAIFTAFGFLWNGASRNSSGMGEVYPVLLALAGLGLLTAIANLFSAWGSKSWQENWENHIDMLEDGIEGRLYKTVWLDDGRVSFSVTKINAALSRCFVGFWCIVTAHVAWRYLGEPSLVWAVPGHITSVEVYVGFIFVLLVVGMCCLCRQRTHLNGTFPKPDGSHGEPFVGGLTCRLTSWCHSSTVAKSWTFIRRRAPDE